MKKLTLFLLFVLLTTLAYGQQIPNLDAIDAVSDGDLYYCVDVSDTTDSANGTGKKCTTSQIKSSFESLSLTNDETIQVKRLYGSPSTYINSDGKIVFQTLSDELRYDYGYYDEDGYTAYGSAQLQTESSGRNYLYYSDGTKIKEGSTTRWQDWFPQGGAGTKTYSLVAATDLTTALGSYAMRTQYTGEAGDSAASLTWASYQTGAGSITQGTQVTASAYVRSQTGLTGTTGVQIYIGENDSGGNYLTSSGSSLYTTVDSDWRRLTYTYTTTNASCSQLNMTVSVRGVDNGDAVDFEIWGPQIELGDTATSFIPTRHRSLTRPAETASTISIDDGKVSIKGSGSNFSLDVGGATKTGDMIASQTPWCDVRAYGAKGDGVTDDSAAIQLAIEAARYGSHVVYFPAGRYYVGTSLDATDLNIFRDNSQPYGSLTFKGAGFGPIGTVIVGNTGSSAILDISGSRYVTIEDMLFEAGSVDPSEVGILMARTSDGEYTEFNVLNRIGIDLDSDATANGGEGTIGIYNIGTEIFSVYSSEITADIPAVFSTTNLYSLTSDFQTLIGGSMSCVKFTQSSLQALSGNAVVAKDIYEITFDETYLYRKRGSEPYALKFLGSTADHVTVNSEVEGFKGVIDLQSARMNNATIKVFIVSTDTTPLINLNEADGKTPILKNSDVTINTMSATSTSDVIYADATGTGVQNSIIKVTSRMEINLSHADCVDKNNLYMFEYETPTYTLPATSSSTIKYPGNTIVNSDLKPENITTDSTTLTLFDDTDVADDANGKILQIRRNAAEGDGVIQLYIDQYKEHRLATSNQRMIFDTGNMMFDASGGEFDWVMNGTEVFEWKMDRDKDQIVFVPKVDGGNHIIFGNTTSDFDHPVATHTTIYGHSALSPNTSNQNYWGKYHDGVDTINITGQGGFKFNVADQSSRGTVTFTGVPVADETMALNGTTITAKADGSGDVDHFTIGGDASANATNLAATINAGSESANCTAWVSGDTVIIEWGAVGTAGNAIVLTEALTNATVDGSGTLGGTNYGVAAATLAHIQEAGGTMFSKVTADPCDNLEEGSLFYNDTSNYYCYCDGTNDVQMHDPTTACF